MAERPPKVQIDREANGAIERLIDRSRRATGARLPAIFARGDGQTTPMLASLIQGGRGGNIRLKLYLSMVLLAGSTHKHRVHGSNAIVDVSSAFWARALALPEPSSSGARRVADAQNQLADRKLISVERRPGQEPIIKLRHPSGSDRPWVEPGTPYIRVPLDVWTRRWLWCLSAKELAVLLAIVDLCGGRGLDGSGGPQPLSGTHLDSYGISVDTWRLASARLEQLELITTDIEVVQIDIESPRRRKRYAPNLDRLEQLAPPPFSE